jgi:uncharacterized membrane protein YuzA (DUF378 family)
MITLYKILSYILLPIAALLGLFSLMFLMAALSSPAALLPVFTMVATVIYVFTSFSFLQKAIVQQQAVKARLRDWIRVNAFVALFVAISSLMQGVTLLANPAMMKEALEQANSMMKQMNQPVTYDLMAMMRGVLYFIIGFAAVLLTHIFISFQFLKKYKEYFVG